jgi:excisionase family DNA binding protein
VSTTAEPPDAPADGLHLLTFEEAAAYLGRSFTVRWIRRHVYEVPKDERIPTRRLGNKRLIKQGELAVWYEAQSRREDSKSRETVAKRKAARV